MLIHLIRHAHAGSRKNWSGPDPERPLSKRGEKQSRLIDEALAGFDVEVDRLWSSRFIRCVQTLEPTAERLGLTIETMDAFTEGGPGGEALDAMLAAAVAGHTVAVSTHGDVIPLIIEEALWRGATLDGPLMPTKGARYELTVVDGAVTHLRHRSAPDGRS